MTDADMIAIASAVLNVIILLVTSIINTKIERLKADIFETFLSKQDYYEFQKRREFHAPNRRR